MRARKGENEVKEGLLEGGGGVMISVKEDKMLKFTASTT